MRILGDAEEAARIEHVARPVPPFTPRSPEGLVSADGSVAFTIVPLVAGEVFHVRGTIEELRALDNASDGLTLNVTGFPALVSDGNTIIQEADAKLLATTALLVLVLLLAVYRSPLLAFVPLFVVGDRLHRSRAGSSTSCRQFGPADRQHVDLAPARADVRRRHRLLPPARRALPAGAAGAGGRARGGLPGDPRRRAGDRRERR